MVKIGKLILIVLFIALVWFLGGLSLQFLENDNPISGFAIKKISLVKINPFKSDHFCVKNSNCLSNICKNWKCVDCLSDKNCQKDKYCTKSKFCIQKKGQYSPCISNNECISNICLKKKCYTNWLMLQKQFEKEDEAKAKKQDARLITGGVNPPINQQILTPPKQDFYDRINPLSRINNILPEEIIIELSPNDKKNRLFAEVDMSKYARMQRSHPEIFRQIIWADSQYPDGRSITYSKSKMWDLAHYIALLEADLPFPASSPPERDSIIEGTFFYNELAAWNMFIPRIAVSLYVEQNNFVSWSLLSMGDSERALIFDGRQFVNYYDAGDVDMYRFYFVQPGGQDSFLSIDGITDWNPFFSYNFLKKNDLIRDTQEETIYALTEWMSVHIFHEAWVEIESNRRDYGYEGEYPVDKILNPPAGIRHWTQGCTGTTSLYTALLQIINIPVAKNPTLNTHAAPIFPTVNLALAHGDDPYHYFYWRGVQEVPINRMFYTIEEFNELNNNDNPSSAHAKQIYLNGFEFMAFSMLKERAFDVINGLHSTEDALIGEDPMEPLFDEETRNIMLAAMDDEIIRIGDGDYYGGYIIIYEGVEKDD